MALGNNQTWVIFWEGSWETSQAFDSRQDTTAACGDFFPFNSERKMENTQRKAKPHRK